jgi:hypothetical protein
MPSLRGGGGRREPPSPDPAGGNASGGGGFLPQAGGYGKSQGATAGGGGSGQQHRRGPSGDLFGDGMGAAGLHDAMFDVGGAHSTLGTGWKKVRSLSERGGPRGLTRQRWKPESRASRGGTDDVGLPGPSSEGFWEPWRLLRIRS